MSLISPPPNDCSNCRFWTANGRFFQIDLEWAERRLPPRTMDILRRRLDKAQRMLSQSPQEMYRIDDYRCLLLWSYKSKTDGARCLWHERRP